MQRSQAAVGQQSEAEVVALAGDVADRPADLLLDVRLLHVAGQDLDQLRHGLQDC